MRPRPLVRPPCRRYASAEVDEFLFRNVDAEGADGGLGAVFVWCSHVIPFWLGARQRRTQKCLCSIEREVTVCGAPCAPFLVQPRSKPSLLFPLSTEMRHLIHGARDPFC